MRENVFFSKREVSDTLFMKTVPRNPVLILIEAKKLLEGHIPEDADFKSLSVTSAGIVKVRYESSEAGG